MRAVRFLLAISLGVQLFAATGYSSHWLLDFRFCPFEIIEVPQLIEDFPIPVGCEVIDCCPGCPGPGPIDWRIRIDGRLTKEAILRFEGIDAGGLKNVKVTGNARLDGNQVRLGAGESRISGLPENRGGRPPVGFVRPILAGEADADSAAAASSPKDADTGIEILQFRGRFVVNRYRVRFVVIRCFRPIIQDRIRVTSNTSGDNTVILTDYRTSGGCQNDLLHRATSTRGIGNALTNAACNSEVSVFSDDNAMSFQTAVTTWTDSMGDEHSVALQTIITAPVSVWLANAGTVPTATNDFANANLLYNQNNTGIQFAPTITDVSGNAAAVATIGSGCGSVAAVQGSAWYTANRINIYYVGGAGGAFTGVNCGADRNVNYLGTLANLGSLPHEIGHAYGLRPSASWGHTNGVAGFGTNNIMWGGGPTTRNHFSVGQAFRLNVDTTSMLNSNGTRTGGTRTCLPNFSDNLCPALALDSLPH